MKNHIFANSLALCLGASQMCKFIFCLSSRREMNEPRRNEGSEDKKEEESFWCCCGYFCKIGMLPINLSIMNKNPVNNIVQNLYFLQLFYCQHSVISGQRCTSNIELFFKYISGMHLHDTHITSLIAYGK